MKKIFFSLSALCLSIGLSAQTVTEDTVPVDIVYSSEEAISDSAVHVMVAYTELEPQLLADIDWLNYTPLKDRNQLRDDKTRFVLMWMSGSPSISIKVDDRVMKFTGAQPWVLFAYMTGWTKYSIEHDYSSDALKCTMAGITNAVAFYKRNMEVVGKNKEMEKFSKMIEDNTLERYVKTALGL